LFKISHSMKPIVFDGKKFALEKEATLIHQVSDLRTRGIYPKLTSILVGDNPGSSLYTKLKKKAAERVGAEMDTYLAPDKSKSQEIIELIESLNNDPDVQGIMVQMPLPEKFKNSKTEIINTIDRRKDVDGLREDSPFLHSTARAVLQIVEQARKALDLNLDKSTFVVVGHTGMVGVPLTRKLKKDGYKVIGCDVKTVNLKTVTLKADVLISATGAKGLIKADMVKEGVVIVDVGYPKGDADTSALAKASFFTPVPGGVGPVTISCLLENLVQSCYNTL
jgi:methylenetetrahydrofolate dehydrogenase (NADP+)/methenyltetrahydrofolate cyclohydrolase